MKKLFALATILALACLALPALAEEADLPVVYMTTDISPEGLMAVYEALGREAAGENVAVKISTGETDSNYLRPELIGEFVQAVDGTIVECNTAYGGQRASTAMHYQLAEDHSYTAIADVDIMDENGSMTLPVEGGTVIAENYVGANLANYDFLVVLSHFKGHAMAGFGGALKNLSIGLRFQRRQGVDPLRRHGRQYVGRRTGRLSGGHGGSRQVSSELLWQRRAGAVHQRDEPAFRWTATATAAPPSRICTTSASSPPPTRWRWIRRVSTLCTRRRMAPR